MLDQEDSAWLAYTILFSLFSIALVIQSTFHWHITPFALYAICIAGGSLYMLLATGTTEAMARSWKDMEPIINQMPVYSIFIFAGIVDWQFVYIRFISTTLRNHRRWGSLHPVIITEKGDATGGRAMDSLCVTHPSSDDMLTIADIPPPISSSLTFSSSISSPSSFLFNARTFWIYVSAIIFHILVILAFITCKIAILDPNKGALASAILSTIMALPAVLNTVAVVYTGSRCHSKLVSRIVGQNRQDATILFLIPILFMIVMTSTTVIAWKAYTEPDLRPFGEDVAGWILVRAFSVYFPLTLLLICCMLKRRKYTNVVEVEDKSKKGATRRPSVNSLLSDRPHNKRHFKTTADY